MNIQAAKLELVKLIVNLENEAVINKILQALKSEPDDFWLELTPQEKEEIEIGIKQLDSGQRTSLEDFVKKVS